MKWLKNIEELTEHIFSNKERASKRHLNSSGAEKPREVFDRVCQQIGNETEAFGFKYFPSQHKLKLESTDKKFSLSLRFSSNRDNVAGQYIELSGAFSIESKELKKFSNKYPLLNYSSDLMLGRDIGVLIDGGKGNLIWNLADEQDCKKSISIITKTARGSLAQLFEDIQNTKLIVDQIEKDNFELNNPMITVQYLLMHDHKNVAEKYLSKFLRRKPEKILADYHKAVEQFDSEGIPEQFIHGMGYGHEIALLEKEYGLELNVPNKR
ncbi:MAG: hypothetical protein RIC35_14800 [Marinoscillum sp.]